MMLEALFHESRLFTVIWQATVWLILGLLAGWLLAARPSRAHAAMVLCMIGAAFTPPITLLLGQLGWGILTPLTVDLHAGSSPPPELEEPASFAASLPGWEQAFLIGWIALSIIFIVRLITSTHRGLTLIRACRGQAVAPIQPVADRAARQLGLKERPRLVTSPRLACPVIWCWGKRPRIILPTGMVQGPEDDRLFGVLSHEMAHLVRRDHIAGLLVEILTCLLPWNPLAWRLRRRIRQAGEQACDEWVLAAGASPTAYARALLDQVPQPASALALAAVTSRTCLRSRIVRILRRHPARPRCGRTWTVAIVSLAAFLTAGLALAQRRPPLINNAEDTAAAGHGEPRPDSPRLALPPGGISSASPVTITPRELDLGTAAAGGSAGGAVWLVNTSDRPIRLLEAKANCGCTVVTGFEPTTLAPGTWMRLEIVMTAPETPDTYKTKHVTFTIEGQRPIKLPVHLRTPSGNT
jgi:beta-lactamase regulating signal transducer with metallopeptidase domain